MHNDSLERKKPKDDSNVATGMSFGVVSFLSRSKARFKRAKLGQKIVKGH